MISSYNGCLPYATTDADVFSLVARGYYLNSIMYNFGLWNWIDWLSRRKNNYILRSIYIIDINIWLFNIQMPRVRRWWPGQPQVVVVVSRWHTRMYTLSTFHLGFLVPIYIYIYISSAFRMWLMLHHFDGHIHRVLVLDSTAASRTHTSEVFVESMTSSPAPSRYGRFEETVRFPFECFLEVGDGQ